MAIDLGVDKIVFQQTFSRAEIFGLILKVICNLNYFESKIYCELYLQMCNSYTLSVCNVDLQHHG